jgi:ketosteroid isomerase-like protein
MSNIDAVTALITAINFDRFAEIEARHQPNVLFQSFRGPTLHDSVAVADWHRTFLRDYADCNYADVEYIEQDDTVVVRATIEAKGYDFRPFTQRIVEVLRMEDGAVAERRMYAMLRDIELDKAATAAMTNALGYRGGSPAESRKLFEDLSAARAANDLEAAKSYYHDQAVAIDGVYGVAVGLDNIVALVKARPRPAFGTERVTAIYFGDHDILVESAIDPAHPRKAEWLRIVDGKIIVAEVYWMLREIGVNPFENLARERHPRQVILPI